MSGNLVSILALAINSFVIWYRILSLKELSFSRSSFKHPSNWAIGFWSNKNPCDQSAMFWSKWGSITLLNTQYNKFSSITLSNTKNNRNQCARIIGAISRYKIFRRRPVRIDSQSWRKRKEEMKQISSNFHAESWGLGTFVEKKLFWTLIREWQKCQIEEMVLNYWEVISRKLKVCYWKVGNQKPWN